MSIEEYTKIKKTSLGELYKLPAYLVAEWLKNQSDFIGEAVAKNCYQQIARSTVC